MQVEEVEYKETMTVAEADEKAEVPAITDLSNFLKRTQSVVPLAVIGIFLMALVAFLYFAREFFMPVLLALILSFLLKPMVRALGRIRIPESVGAAIAIVVFGGAIVLAVSNLIQPATDWLQRAPESIHQIEDKVQKFLRPAQAFSKAAENVGQLGKDQTAEPTTKIEMKNFSVSETLLGYTRSFLTGAAETVVLLYFLLAAGDLFMQKMVRILPSLQDKKKAVEIAREVQQNISTFLFTITVINICLGICVGCSVALLGMPNPVLWGVVAGLLNFIPYFGPICGVTILAIAGLVTFETLGRALMPPLIYFCFHAIESNFVTPMILGRRLTLNPVVIFISLIFWTWMWGISGALLSVPMLMMLKIFCDHFKPLAPIGEFLSGENAAKKAKAENGEAPEAG